MRACCGSTNLETGRPKSLDCNIAQESHGLTECSQPLQSKTTWTRKLHLIRGCSCISRSRCVRTSEILRQLGLLKRTQLNVVLSRHLQSSPAKPQSHQITWAGFTSRITRDVFDHGEKPDTIRGQSMIIRFRRQSANRCTSPCRLHRCIMTRCC